VHVRGHAGPQGPPFPEDRGGGGGTPKILNASTPVSAARRSPPAAGGHPRALHSDGATARDGRQLTAAEELCARAGRMLGRGQADDAYDLFCDVLALDSHNAKALSALAVLNHKQGAFEAARSLYKRCLRADPTRYKTAYNLGRLEHECGNLDGASALYELSLELEPDDETACSALAYQGLLLAEEYGDFEGARSCFERSLARNPEHVRTLDHQCALLAMCGEDEAAKLLHDAVRALDPGHLLAFCPYAGCLFNGHLLADRTPSRALKAQAAHLAAQRAAGAQGVEAVRPSCWRT